GTIFDDQAGTPIAYGNFQFSGRFKPEPQLASGSPYSLSAFNDLRVTPNGTWTLVITSSRLNDGTIPVGTLQNWKLEMRTAGVQNSTITITGDPNAVIRDLLIRLNVTHGSVNDLIVTLYAPDGTPVTLVNRAPGADQAPIQNYGSSLGDLVLTDSAGLSVQSL